MVSHAMDLLVTFTAITLGMLCFRPILLKRFGPTQTYQLWLAVPLALIVSLLPESAKIPVVIESAAAYGIYTAGAITEAESANEGMNILLLCYFAGVGLGFTILIGNAIRAFPRKLVMSNPIEKSSIPSCTLPIHVSDSIPSPSLVGVINPAILIPSDFFSRFSEFQQRSIIEHELVHHKRKDIVWNLIANIIAILFWFHPMAWFGYRLFRQDQELSCDESVLKGKPLIDKQEYAQALLLSKRGSSAMALPTSFGKNGDRKMMQERINTIRKTGSYNSRVAALIFVITACLAATQLQANSLASEDAVKGASMLKPIVRVNPVYPAQAKQAGIEGWVVLEFGVTDNGTVENIRVIDSHPDSLFDEAAKRAIAKWRYRPTSAQNQVNTVELEFKL